MKTKQLFIPDRINTGFQNRTGTYTGKLAYVIYFDQKGVLRKEASWKSWRDKSIDPIEYLNEPTEGFVLNKNVGGNTGGHSWEQRQAYIRVYDPRGFEFEITLPNLLFILSESDCYRGKGLEGKFVYAWDGADLVLLPVSAQDYQSSKEHTDLVSMKVKAKELIPGATYLTKDLKTLVYLGRLNRHMPLYRASYYCSKKDSGITKQYVFWDGDSFMFHSSMAKLGKLVSDSVVGNYAELMESYYKSQYGTKIAKLFLVEDGDTRSRWFTEENGLFHQHTDRRVNWDDKTSLVRSISRSHSYGLREGLLYCEYAGGGSAWNPEYVKEQRNNYPSRFMRSPEYDNAIPWTEPTNFSLHALLESGTECIVTSNGLLLI